jgi:hypothetical protein
MIKCILLRNSKYDQSQTVHECSLDGSLQTLRFLFRYEIQNGSYGGGHLEFSIGIKKQKLVEDLPMINPGQFGFNCPSGFREEAF